MMFAPRFERSPQLEYLRRKLASDSPGERTEMQATMTSQTRISLGHYEAQLRAYLAAGNELPKDVHPLSSPL